MADPAELEQDAVGFATRAVTCDQNSLYDTAIFYYHEAAAALVAAAQAGSPRLTSVIQKANEYHQRAEQLQGLKQDVTTFAEPPKTPQTQQLERARFLVEQAFEEDMSDNKKEALELYMQAAELCIRLRPTAAANQQGKVTKLAEQALERAEILKVETKLTNLPDPDQISLTPATPLAPPPGTQRSVSPGAPRRVLRPLGFSLQDDEPKSAAPAHRQSTGGGGGGAGGYSKEEIQVLRTENPSKKGGGGWRGQERSRGEGGSSKEEIQVLRTTSYINEREYVPFMSVDMKERFAYPVPFTDKHGMLALSPKQKNRFSKWVRPEDFIQDPRMILAVSSFSIRQTVISDCSFVASLAISAQYERRFKKKLITSIIFPQNRAGEPVYNPCGKYMVKFNINGVHRKVVIDDYLPMSRDNELLCSHSSNRSELWVSLLEKAYLKVMGGYDFPGSNSNIDLHALTGWIPERVAIRPGSEDFDANKEFSRMMDRFHKGHCLITMATGEMGDAEADRAGLVPTHAYAMLDIRDIKGLKLIQLKNPWSHMRWKGNYSETDTTHWTPDLKRTLNFDPASAAMVDNGVFWIDYESVQRFYDVVYINWNPELFAHTTCIHGTWKVKEGPKKDAYNIGDNPQYRLEVKAKESSAVWILLTRHITDKEDFANNRQFITVLVYKSMGKRIYYPYDPPPYKDGVRINSPHYLCKMVQEKGSTVYNLVLSQYEKNNSIYYTLRVYSTAEFSFSKISEPYNAQYEKQVTGQWKGKTAGGCANFTDTHSNNPIYQLQISNNNTNNQVLIELRGPKQYGVGFDVTTISETVPNSPGSFKKKTSGDFRRGFTVLELENLPGGVFNIRPCTFKPGLEGPFFLNISASIPVSLSQLQ